ncbi:hypothetical protein EYD45_06505 [Hyunsoonleella flava]|uniref:Uncharacterized protein n=1 Tax=Hyunsoonleella flava TaxID=2527939 RepID=A0A4Q9FEI6_9FLAO|nr:hypothetical protein [Hyunsoonleella flava]TBN04267.1 hypothetical protein EYD45_06505 [Hyunsoonleella flava]
MRKLVLILFSLFSLSTSGQDKACLNFKTGKFKYVDASYADWHITRTLSEQIETNTATGLVIHNDIKWTSACEFTLTCSKVSQPKYKHAIGKVFKVVIIETSKQGYTCILMHNDIQPNNMQFEMVRMD